jgi:biotin carboxylase
MSRCLSKPSALISIGASKNQIPLITRMKRLGYQVIGIDRNPDSPGILYLDEYLPLSTYEAGPIIAALTGLKDAYTFKGVFTRSSGPPVITTAVIADSFDLPGATEKAAVSVVNKNRLMKICRLNGVATPQSMEISCPEYFELISARLPCIVKPALSIAGKKGITLIRHENEIEQAFQSAKSCSHTGEVLLEKFVPGDDVTLMSVVSKGKAYPVVMIRELNEFDPNGKIKARGVSMPYNPGQEKTRSIYSLAQSIVDVSGVRNSPFLMSCRSAENAAPVLIEVHLDFGGDGILDELFPKSTELDFITYTLEIILGIKEPGDRGNIHFKPATITR